MSFSLAFALNTLTKEEVVDKIRDYIKNNAYGRYKDLSQFAVVGISKKLHGSFR